LQNNRLIPHKLEEKEKESRQVAKKIVEYNSIQKVLKDNSYDFLI
jgi:hypothetical protein